jgi:hypothetical protein
MQANRAARLRWEMKDLPVTIAWQHGDVVIVIVI